MFVKHRRVMALAVALALLVVLVALPVGCRSGEPWTQSRAERSLSALPITETDDTLIAALATTGDSSRPKNG